MLEAIHAAAALGWEAVPGSDPARTDLTAEAPYLAETLFTLTPNEPKPKTVLALILSATARRIVYAPLSELDTSLLEASMIANADQVLSDALRTNRLGRFQLQAAIQSAHAGRARTGRTDWKALETLHAARNRLHPTAGGRIAAAAVTPELRGPHAGLTALDALTDLDRFQPYWALKPCAGQTPRTPAPPCRAPLVWPTIPPCALGLPLVSKPNPDAPNSRIRMHGA